MLINWALPPDLSVSSTVLKLSLKKFLKVDVYLI